MTQDSLADLSATELVSGYQDGSFTPVDVLDATIIRIERVNPVLNAFVGLDLESAGAAAAASTKRWAAGIPLGPLDGVTVTIKDTMALSGWPTLKGSLHSDERKVLAEDSPTAARLKESGAVILGKTTAPEFAWKGTSDSPRTGLTRNPWDPNRTTGGSSAGAAAAAATGMGALHPGTDGAGSVRIPAAFCGIFTLKPTFSRIPIYPPSTGGLLSHVGPMTRTVGDAALMLDVIAQPDSREIYPAAPDRSPWSLGLEDGVKGLRIAYTPTWDGYPVHDDVAAAVETAVRVLAGLGAIVTEVDPGFALPRDDFLTIWDALLSQPLMAVPEDQWHLSDPGLVETTRRGRSLSARSLLEADRSRFTTMMAFQRVLAGHDIIISPQMPCTALPLGRDLPDRWNADMRLEHWIDWSPFTYPLNLTRHPAASVPIGFDGDHLPIAMQVIGAHFDDRRVMRVARAFEREQPFAMPNLDSLDA